MAIKTKTENKRVIRNSRKMVVLSFVCLLVLGSGLSMVKHFAIASEQAAEELWLMENPPTVRYSGQIPH